MRLEVLEITNFRNIRSAIIRTGPGVNIFTGDNGSGKTNLLEAIFALCLGRSQRGARDIMLVGDTDDDFYRLQGVGRTSDGEVHLACAYQKGGRKKITVDENPARLSRLFRIFSLISMAPEDVALLAGSPSIRRQFMDLHLSQASSSYLRDLTDYNKALAQKNAFLKENTGLECPFDPLMVELGARIMVFRQGFIHFLQGLAPGYYNRTAGLSSDDLPEFEFDYRPNVPFADKSEITEKFEKKLTDYRDKEAALEMAIVGPHRDDVDFRIGGFPARGYGSQGELRSAAVAVMLATANFLESRRGEIPILLLDEIFAELDKTRRGNLVSLFDSFEQIFLTSSDQPPNKLRDRGKHFFIHEGEVREK